MNVRALLAPLLAILIGGVVSRVVCGPPTIARAQMTQTDLVAHVKAMQLAELNQLIASLEIELGVKAALLAVPSTPTPTPTPPPPPTPVEKTEFTVVLVAAGANKIAVIKAIREITGLGLKESKDLVESAPKVVKEAIAKADADAIMQKLAEAGATVEIK